MRILVADDEKEIRTVLSNYIEAEGHEALLATNGYEALDLFQYKDPDLILLDVMMPGKDGFEVCKRIRETSQVPIMMITARSEDYDRIMGLDLGADDYVVKPFSPAEVMARVRAILRRMGTPENQTAHRLGKLEVSALGRVSYEGEILPFTKKEADLLWTLLDHKGQILSRVQLLDLVWGDEYEGDLRTVDTHIKRLRSRLQDLTVPFSIITYRGRGYALEMQHEHY